MPITPAGAKVPPTTGFPKVTRSDVDAKLAPMLQGRKVQDVFADTDGLKACPTYTTGDGTDIYVTNTNPAAGKAMQLIAGPTQGDPSYRIVGDVQGGFNPRGTVEIASLPLSASQESNGMPVPPRFFVNDSSSVDNPLFILAPIGPKSTDQFNPSAQADGDWFIAGVMNHKHA